MKGLCLNNLFFPRCDINLDLCGTNPCQNGGECVDSGNGVRYTCICKPGYTGDNCETDIGECCLSLSSSSASSSSSSSS